MTRFNITLDYATSMIQDVLKIAKGGEIFVPKIKSLRVIDLAKAVNNKNKLKIIGVRPGEKIHEQMISSRQLYYSSFKNYYAILPAGNKNLIKKFIAKNRCKKVDDNFEYSSNKNGKFLSIQKLKINN